MRIRFWQLQINLRITINIKHTQSIKLNEIQKKNVYEIDKERKIEEIYILYIV